MKKLQELLIALDVMQLSGALNKKAHDYLKEKIIEIMEELKK